MLNLYQKGKDKQWDSAPPHRLVPRARPDRHLLVPDEVVPIFGSAHLGAAVRAEKDEVRHHYMAWTNSQFLHGEQGALICSAKIVGTVPDLDAKFYAATQTMDEARHVETYARSSTTSSSWPTRSTRRCRRCSTRPSPIPGGTSPTSGCR
jgi:hypothetical protein